MVQAISWGGSSPGWAPEGAIGIVTEKSGRLCTVVWLQNNTMPNGQKIRQSVSSDMQLRIKVLSPSEQGK